LAVVLTLLASAMPRPAAGSEPEPEADAAAEKAGGAMSVRSGNWNDPGTWSGGQVPTSNGSAVVAAGHVVTVTADVAVAGVAVKNGATLRLDPTRTVRVSSDRNVVVEGLLQMRPASPTVSHLLRFVDVDESRFVGGGMQPLASDVGLWVMGSGRLDLAGSPKTAWTRASGSIAADDASVNLVDPPSGWQEGDELAIAPTQAPTVGDAAWAGFDQAGVTGVSGSTVSLSTPVTRPHPMVNGQWTAEVMNLTRNVRLEGTAGGRSHVFIRSSRPQVILYTAIRFMGPRKNGDKVAGRYGLHFHHSYDGSRGSQVIGTVVRDTDSHAFVPHRSYGVTLKDDISFNTTEDAYWWDPTVNKGKFDPEEVSHDTVMDHDIAALVKPGASAQRLSGFVMAGGQHNVIRDSVAVGVQGTRDANGFKWPEQGPGAWDFSRGNVAHNNKMDGIFDWENGGPPRVIANFVAYYNGGAGIDHGSYFNRYRFENIVLYGNARTAVDLRAVSGTAIDQTAVGPDQQIRFDNVVLDGAGISTDLVVSQEHATTGRNRPTVFRNATFTGAQNAVRMGGSFPNEIEIESSLVLTPQDAIFEPGAAAANKVRIELLPDILPAIAIEITAFGRLAIPLFGAFVDTSPPNSSIVSPLGGSLVSGTVDVTTAGYDLVGVTRVELLVDGVLRSTAEETSPTFPWSTTGLAQGAHTLQVRAYDAAGNSNQSALATVFVVP
jgi:hypothetical protein